jgi:hypothetical protein
MTTSLMVRLQQTGHGGFDLVDQFVDDGVKLDLHAFALGQVGHADVNARVEAKNDGAEAEASSTSDSVMVPTALWMTSSETRPPRFS